MQKPGILFVLPWKFPTSSGVGEVVINLARAARDGGRLRPVIACNDPDRDNFAVETFEDMPLVSGHLRTPATAGHAARRLAGLTLGVRRDIRPWRQFLEAQDIHVINAHHYSPGYVLFSMMRASRRAKFRLVYSLHGSDIAELRASGPASNAVARWALRQADALVCCSQSLAGSVRDAMRVDDRRVHAVLNGIDPAALDHARDNAYRPATGGFDNYLVSVGTFAPEKGHDTLLQAYLQLVREGLKSALVLIGHATPHLNALRSQVRRHGLQGHVFFVTDLDHQSTLAAIDKARLLVQPSREEAFGLPLIEAAYLRTPVVATGAGGIPEVLGGYYPYLVRPDDPAALARVIDDALFNPTETRRQVHLLRRRVAARFTWQHAYREYTPIWLGGAR